MKQTYKIFLIVSILILLCIGGAAATNINDYNASLLLLMHNNGTAGSTTFTDSTGKTVYDNGAVINTTVKKFGSGSGYFDGHSIASVDNTTPIVFGNNNFTISLYAYADGWNSTDNEGLLSTMQGDNLKGWAVTVFQGGIGWTTGNGTNLNYMFSSNPVPTSQQVNVIVTRVNGNTSVYVNGVYNGSNQYYDVDSHINTTLGAFYPNAPARRYLSGGLDEVAVWNRSIPVSDLYPLVYEIGVAPNSSFTQNTTGGITPVSVLFTNTSQNYPQTLNWTFRNVAGNNTEVSFSKSTGNPEYVFPTGNYSIKLYAANSGGTNTSTQVSWVNVSSTPAPVVSFTASPTTGVNPLTVSFNDTSTSSTSIFYYNSSFGDGAWVNQTSFPATNITHLYSTAGSYTVTWYVTNVDGTGSATTTITVYGAAHSAFSMFNNAGTAPFTTYLYDTSTNLTPGPATYSWDLGDGNTSTSANLYFTWNATGMYNVTHTVSNGLSSSTSFTNVTVGTPTPPVVAPVASFYGGPQTGSVPLTVFFTDVSSNTPTSWNWSFGDGKYSELQNPQHQYNSSGFRTVNLTATNSAGSNITSRVKFVKVS